MNEPVKRLLVMGPSCLAELVMAQSLFITLKQREPEATLGVVAPAWSQPIMARMPEVDEVWSSGLRYDEFDIRSSCELAAKLKGRYDRAIVLPHSWKAALIPFLARIPERIGFLGKQRYGVLNERRRLDNLVLDQTVKRFVSLGLPEDEVSTGQFAIPSPRLTIDRDNLVNLRIAHQLSSRPAIGLMPATQCGSAQQWPPANFHQLAERLVSDGYEVRIFGDPKDQVVGDAIAQGLLHTHNLFGKTDLADAVDLLADCRQVVTNDSGLMHVAAAVGTRVHAVYGSSSPACTPPLTANAQIHYQPLEGSPCFQRECPLGHTNCLKNLDVESVYTAVSATPRPVRFNAQ